MSVVIYTLNGTGTEIPAINVAQATTLIIIQGTAVAIGNYAISYTGTPNLTTQIDISYRGSLDITTNSTTFSILGQSFNQNDLNRELEITARWTGSTWKVITKKDFKEAGIIEASHLSTDSVTTAAIADGSITEPKLATDSVSTVKIQDDAVTAAKINADVAGLGLVQNVSGALDVNVDDATIEISTDTVQVKDLGITTGKINDLAVTSGKLADSSVTTAKILNDNVTTAKIADGNVTANKLASDSVTTVKILDSNVTTAKINDNAVTNDKLANMTASSVKIGDASGNPTDLVLGNNEVPTGNGSTIVAKSIPSLLGGMIERHTMEISFEADATTNTIYFPYDCYLENIAGYVYADVAGTDPGDVIFYINATRITGSPTTYDMRVNASSASSSAVRLTFAYTAHESLNNKFLRAVCSKTTPGGKVTLTIIVVRN